jgi:hypothetical protein
MFITGSAHTVVACFLFYNNKKWKIFNGFNVMVIALKKALIASEVDCGCPVEFVRGLLNTLTGGIHKSSLLACNFSP